MRLLSVLTVVGVLVGAAGLLLPLVLGGGDGDDARREAVVSRAKDFAVTYNTYDVNKKADYQKRMKGLLTKDYDKEFRTVTDAIFKAIESKNQKSGDAKVLGVAIDSLKDDSAVALVAVNSSITTSSDEAAVQRRFRWKVTFTREKGEWLVNQFETVAPLEASTGDSAGQSTDGATPTPTPSPSEGGGQ